MKYTVNILFLFFVLSSCGQQNDGIDVFADHSVEFDKSIFRSSNNEFTISLPKNWHVNEDKNLSDTLLYIFETGSSNSSFAAMNILKLKTIYGSIDDEFDKILEKNAELVSNRTVIDKNGIKIRDVLGKYAVYTYDYDGKTIQKGIDVFIPMNQSQYYLISIVCDMNSETKDNLSMLLRCVETFEFI